MPEAEITLHYLHGGVGKVRIQVNQFENLTERVQRFFEELSARSSALANVERIEAELIEGDA